MPEMSGLELISVIREHENHKDTPIIFLTSSGMRATVSAAMELGVCDYVIKPFNNEVLLQKIEKHIGGADK
jgi:two-component system chemotaxis response regulator CheY